MSDSEYSSDCEIDSEFTEFNEIKLLLNPDKYYKVYKKRVNATQREKIIKECIDTLYLNRDINKCNRYGTTVLMVLCSKGSLELVKYVLSTDANTVSNGTNTVSNDINSTNTSKIEIDKCTIYNQTALYWATLYHRTEIVSLLLKSGANRDISDTRGTGLLDIAKRNDYKEIITPLTS